MLQISIVPVTDWQQNCSLVFDDQTKNGVVVDPGGDLELIVKAVTELELKIQAVWLTHGHLDHAGSAEAAKKKFEVQIIGPHAADKLLLDNIEMAAAQYNATGFYNATPDRWLSGGDKLNIDEHEFEVRHCPGHAPGHVIFINHANKIILMGDVLFQGSIGRTDLPGGSHQQLLESIRDQVLTLDDDYQFICGHSAPSTIGHERKTNPFLTDIV